MRSLAVILVTFFLAAAGAAQTVATRTADPPFDPARLSRAEIRFLQTALSFADTYDAMLDGQWGGYSQRALEQALGCAAPCRLSARDVERFMSEAGERLAAAGWQVEYLPAVGGSLLVPGGSATGGMIGPGFAPTHSSPDVTIYAARGPAAVAEAVGREIRRNARADRNSYFPASKPRLRIWTAYAPFNAIFGDGNPELGVFYLRSDFRDGAWSSVLVAAPAGRINVLRTVANSISAGRGEPLVYPEPPSATVPPATDAAPASAATEDARDPLLADAELGNTDEYTIVLPSDVPDPEPATASAPLLAEVERILGHIKALAPPTP